MKIAYKLTDSGMRTYYEFQWELGKWYETTGEGDLCFSGWFHFYSDPLVGLFLNPVHAGIENPRLFRAEVEGNFIDDHGAKCGYSRARLIEELLVPQISSVQRVRFAILCAKEVYKEKEWNKWADNWLSGKDRTEESAAGAAYTVEGADSVAKITDITTKSAEVSAFYAAKSATFTSEIIANAAKSAFYATESKEIDLIGIAQKAMKE